MKLKRKVKAQIIMVHISYLKQIGVTKCRTQAENIIPLRMFWYWLHDCPVNNYQMLWGCFDRPTKRAKTKRTFSH